MAKILIAEDDDLVLFGLTECLTAASHTVEGVESGKEAFERLRLYKYDLIILDWGLPQMSGVEICTAFRKSGGSTPILILTAKAEIANREAGLDSGADDYLTKPFSMIELSARVRSLLRRSHAYSSDKQLSAAGLILDSKSFTVTNGEKSVRLVAKEFAVLEFLMKNKNQAFDVNQLLDRVWSSESDATEDAVRQSITRLRKKLSTIDAESAIKTIKGLGYVVEA